MFFSRKNRTAPGDGSLLSFYRERYSERIHEQRDIWHFEGLCSWLNTGRTVRMHVFPFCFPFALLDRCKDGQQVPQRNFSSNHVLGFECRPLVGVNENKSFLALHVACVLVGSHVGYPCNPRTSDCFTPRVDCLWKQKQIPLSSGFEVLLCIHKNDFGAELQRIGSVCDKDMVWKSATYSNACWRPGERIWSWQYGRCFAALPGWRWCRLATCGCSNWGDASTRTWRTQRFGEDLEQIIGVSHTSFPNMKLSIHTRRTFYAFLCSGAMRKEPGGHEPAEAEVPSEQSFLRVLRSVVFPHEISLFITFHLRSVLCRSDS